MTISRYGTNTSAASAAAMVECVQRSRTAAAMIVIAAPNSYVLAIDSRAGLMVTHELVARDGGAGLVVTYDPAAEEGG
jgi:hypothetical protein